MVFHKTLGDFREESSETTSVLVISREMRYLSLVLLLISCASVEFKKAGPNDPGLHYNRPAPYMQVSKGPIGCSSTIVWLPDQSQEYVAVIHGGLFGTVSFKPTLENGWNLTSIDTNIQNNQAATVISGLSSVATGIFASKMLVRTNAQPVMHPGLYRLDLSANSQSPLTAVFSDTDDCSSKTAKRDNN